MLLPGLIEVKIWFILLTRTSTVAREHVLYGPDVNLTPTRPQIGSYIYNRATVLKISILFAFTYFEGNACRPREVEMLMNSVGSVGRGIYY